MQNSKTKFPYFSLLFIFLITGCSCKNVPQPKSELARTTTEVTVSAKSDDAGQLAEKVLAEFKARQEMQAIYLAYASSVAIETADPEAIAISNFLNANTVTYMTLGSGLISLDTVQRQHQVPLLLVIDDELTRAFIPLGKGIYGAVIPYKPAPLMVIMVKDVSKLFKALVLLHEGFHAMSYYSMPPPLNITEEDVALEEVRAYEFENRLIKKIGGKKYATMLKGEIARIIKSKSRATDQEIAEQKKLRYADIDEIFGTNNDEERECFFELLNLEAGFQYVDMKIADKTLAKKLKAKLYLTARKNFLEQ